MFGALLSSTHVVISTSGFMCWLKQFSADAKYPHTACILGFIMLIFTFWKVLFRLFFLSFLFFFFFFLNCDSSLFRRQLLVG